VLFRRTSSRPNPIRRTLRPDNATAHADQATEQANQATAAARLHAERVQALASVADPATVKEAVIMAPDVFEGWSPPKS
jgi:hypothetical protein